jgi:hypothetical protein
VGPYYGDLAAWHIEYIVHQHSQTIQKTNNTQRRTQQLMAYRYGRTNMNVPTCDYRGSRKNTEHYRLGVGSNSTSYTIKVKSQIIISSQKPGVKDVLNRLTDNLKEIKGIN